MKNYGKVLKAKTNKFKCATNGKYNCDCCGNEIKRGNSLRIVDVKFANGAKERFTFDSKKCRDKFCSDNKLTIG